MKFRCAVTGASGFLGTAISKQLLKSSHHVTALVRDATKAVNANEIQHWDLDTNNANLSNIDVLIHNAAYIPKSHNDPDEAAKCLMSNGVATLELLQTAQKAGVKTFIYISAGNAYDWRNQPATELNAIYPSARASYYLTSKIVGDIFAEHFRSISDMRVVILRPSSLYGEGMKRKSLIPNLIGKLKNNQPLELEKIGNYDVDLVHVDDVAWMVDQAVSNELIRGPINLGGGQPASTIRVAQILASLLGKQISEYVLPKQTSHPTLDITVAKSFGYSPRDLTDGLASCIGEL
jgi:UDP-glucose 4-epimerase